jgi:toxin ParE1/3/4
MAVEKLPSYRIARVARDDLDEIWLYSAEQWSNEQADQYLDGFYDAFELLTRYPEIAREWRETDPPVRLLPHRSHLIVYRTEQAVVVVVRVVHLRSDWLRLLQSDAL